MTQNTKWSAAPAATGGGAAVQTKSFGQRLSRGRTEAVASVGTVEIVGLPQALHTRTFGGLDVLFVPILETSRDMMTFIDKMCGTGESRQQAVSMARIRLASEMLQDPSFTLATRDMEEDNTYFIDLEKGVLIATARLYAVVRHRTSLFKIKIEGNIAEGPYMVQNTATGSAVIQVDESQMRQPGYFTTFLPGECLRAHIEKEATNPLEKSELTLGEVRILVPVNGQTVPFILRQKDSSGGWDIIDGRANQWLGVLPQVALNHLSQLVEGLARIAKKG
jgi:hypothetical protein